ncbi:MAG: HAD hydrolase family protein [Pyrinomonadaceae bacterium]
MTTVQERAKRIELLIMDCDGVLTDGRLYFDADGEALKVFHVRDGYGLKLWHEAGYKSGIISGRKSAIVENRAHDLGIEFVWLGREEKTTAFHELVASANIPPEHIAFIADDSIDLPIFPLVGLSVAVRDAHDSVRDAAHLVTQKNGGRGAVRELIDLLLDSKKV